MDEPANPDVVLASNRGVYAKEQGIADWLRWKLAQVKPDLHEPGVLCVECTHPENVEYQRRIYHPAYRGCVLRTEKEVEE